MDWEKTHRLTTDLFGVLPERKNVGPRYARAFAVLSTIGVGLKAYGAAKALAQHVQKESKYRIVIKESNFLFWKVERWMAENMEPASMRSVLLSDPYGEGSTVLNDTRREAVVEIAGHRVEISSSDGDSDAPATPGRTKAERELRLNVDSLAARTAVIEHLLALSRETRKSLDRKVSVYVPTNYDTWNRRAEIAGRSLDTVVLDAEVKNRVLAGLSAFMESEQRWTSLGIPWHYGVLLEGPPGTGKTSFASALANHLGMDVYILQLSSVKNDASLAELIDEVPGRAMLILEDIDVARASSSREESEENRGVTLAGLLNALDGLRTPPGMITVMTSNAAHKLDPALIRPGRVDIRARLGNLGTDQLNGLVSLFLGESWHFGYSDEAVRSADVSPAKLTGALREVLEPDLEAVLSIVERMLS
jgi:ATPase family associated with various cellular activities (AAA)